jgi:phenylacetate-CoA ligase
LRLQPHGAQWKNTLSKQTLKYMTREPAAQNPYTIVPMDRPSLDSWIARKIGLPDAPLRRESIEWYQLKKLREVLRYARHKSPFYKKYLAGFSEDISSLAELSLFPLTTADHLRSWGGRSLCVSLSEIERVVTLDSSGTAGQPKRIYFTAQDLELTLDFFCAGMATFTRHDDRVVILLPCERKNSVGDLLARALVRLGAAVISYGPVTDAAHAADIIAREQVSVIVGIPLQVRAIARQMTGMNTSSRCSVKKVLLTSDYVSDAVIRSLQQVWDCTVYQHYGMTEMGLGGGVFCAALTGYHMREADLYVEIIDPHSGVPLPDGEFGEIVFTTLTRKGMPLVRYRTGDISRYVPGACPCGTVLKKLEKIRWRHEDRIQLSADLHVTMSDLDEALLPLDGIADFAAFVSLNGQQSVLCIKAMPVDIADRKITESMKYALLRIPAIEHAAARGVLALQLRTADNLDPDLKKHAKRKIVRDDNPRAGTGPGTDNRCLCHDAEIII